MVATSRRDAGEVGAELPVALCRVLRGPRTPEGRRFELVVDRCPFCSKKHAHGGGAGTTPALGSRLSHCADTSIRTGYELVPVDGAR